MYIRETFINETKGYQFGESHWYETFTDDLGALFRSLQREYGQCTGSMYRDVGNKTERIGWVFSKRMEYEDARPDWSKDKRFYTRQVWVRLSTTEPIRECKTTGIQSPWADATV